MRRLLEHWQPLASGLSLGCYLARIIAEASRAPWRLPWLLLLLLTASVGGIALAYLAQRRRFPTSPLLVLAAYAFFPRVAPEVALGVLLVAIAALAALSMPAALGGIVSGHEETSWWPEVLVGGAALTLYVYTLAPTILPADSGEFQVVAQVLGVAHPPGYPLYTLLGKLFTFIPVGDAAYRVSLLSAAAAAAAIALTNRLTRQMTGSTLVGLASSLALTAAPTFWAQGTTANIRSLTAFFVIAQIYSLYRYGMTKERRYLWAFALLFGLGITHHGSLGLLAAPYLAYLLIADRGLLLRWRMWLGPLLGCVATFAITLYLPIRSAMGAPFDPAPITSVSAFLDHVLARGFGGDMFAFVRPDLLVDRLPVLGNILVMQFGYVFLAAGLLGAIALWRESKAGLVLVGGVFLVNAFVAITYRAPQTVEYLMPAYMGLAPLAGLGIKALIEWRKPALNALILGTFLWAGAANLAGAYPSYAELSRDTTTRATAEALLREAPSNALILSNWHEATPLWYLQLVEGMRPDVDVEYVYPEGATPMGDVWGRRIAEGLVSRPVLVTNRYLEFESLPYRFVPFHGAEEVIAGSLGVPEGMQPADIVFGDKIRICGYQLAGDHLMSGEEVVLRLCWQPLQPLDRDYSFFVHLVRQLGQAPLGQGDKTHPAARYQVGEVIIDEYRIPLLPTATPGSYQLACGIYFTKPDGWERLLTSSGADMASLAQVTVEPQRAPPVTAHPTHLAFAGGPTCIGADYDTSVAGATRVYLHWVAPAGPSTSYEAVLWRGGAQVGSGSFDLGAGYGTSSVDIAPGDEALRLELRQGGNKLAYLGPWGRSWGNPRLPAQRAGERQIVLGGEMALKGAAWEPAEAWQAGEVGRVALRFEALRPLSRDYTVSVSLVGADGRMIAQLDGTPALGAIPTLKWIRGTAVQDLHLLSIPADAPLGEATLRLTVYDAFTLRPLAISDERLAREGQGTQMELGRVTIQP